MGDDERVARQCKRPNQERVKTKGDFGRSVK